MPFNLGFGEVILIGMVILLFFGAKRIPEIAGSFGKGIREFKKSLSDTQDAVMKPDDPRAVGPGRQLDAPPTTPPGGGEPKRLSQ